MDMIVATSAGARHVLDIMRVKPGCVITDINMPMIFSKKQCEKRPDVLVIRGGEILLPGEHVDMGDIGLPPRVAYAGLAETIILALEGRFEVFTVGTAPQWDKVREIYRLGLKHGMQLAAISGVDGIYSDEDIARVREYALKEANRA
jgi:predicted amino acid dehydrogenase